MGKKNASRRHSDKRRRRTLKQRRKPRPSIRRPAEQPQHVVGRMSFASHGEDHDDCPYCVAASELGIENGAPITEQQYAAYRARADELIKEEGMAPGIRMTQSELMRRYDWINDRLRERGIDVDRTPPAEMDDAQFGETMRLVDEFGEQYDRLN